MSKARKPDPAVIREADKRGIDAVLRFLAMHGSGSQPDDRLSAFGETVPYRWELEEWVKRKAARRSFWSNTGAAASILIALVAAGFTGLQWHEAHNQLQLTLKPHVDFDTEDETDFPPFGIAIINEGPGPAVVKSLAYFLDRKPMKDLDAAATAGNVSLDHLRYFSMDPGDVMAVQEKDWLLQFKPAHGKKANPKDTDHFADFIDDHLAIEVTFCSVVDETACWTKCSAKDQCSK